MRTGKLSISRGNQIKGEGAPRLALVPLAEGKAKAETAPASPDYQLVHDRLTSLERLARLFEHGALSAEEFAAEKQLILGLPADELVLRAPAPVSFVPAVPRKRPGGPSLFGRLFRWKLLPLGVVAGLGLSMASQPESTMRFFDESLRLFGV